MVKVLCSLLMVATFIIAPFSSSPGSQFGQFAVQANDLRISQVYGGGGNTGAPYQNDFIEIYCGIALPTPEVAGTLAMSLSSAKVALVNTTTAISGFCPGGWIDIVGYGPTDCSEGAAAPTSSNITVALRNSNGCLDSDNNSIDFTAVTPAPRNSVSPMYRCSTDYLAPTVTSITPTSGQGGVALDSTITVNFSEAVDLSADWLSISCIPSGYTFMGGMAETNVTLTVVDPTDFTMGDACTATVDATKVSDRDGIAPLLMAANHVWTFYPLACSLSATKIHDIQGSGTDLALPGSHTVEAIVVGDYQVGGYNGFYLQEEDTDADADATTSGGIFVYYPSGPVVQVGDQVRLSGTASDYTSGTSKLTQLSGIDGLEICSTGNPLPTEVTVDLPVSTASDLERFEGMRVVISDTMTVNEVYNLGRYGEVTLSSQGRNFGFTHTNLPDVAGSAAHLATLPTHRLILDDGLNIQNPDPVIYPSPGLSATNTLRVGDTVSGLAGVFDERFSAYRIQPTGTINFSHTNQRPSTPTDPGGGLRVAAFNVLNYFNGDGTGGGFPTSRGASTALEFTRQRDKIIQAILGLDAAIVGVMEIENDGYSATSAIQDLVNGLNTASSPGTYAFIDPGLSLFGTDEIAVGILYRPTLVDTIDASATITTGAFVQTPTTDRRNRNPMAQSFIDALSGETFTVVVNHLKSKGSACSTANPSFPIADPDLGDGQGNCNQTRLAAVKDMLTWLATDPTGNGDPDDLIIGDLNSYAREDPLRELENNGYVNLLKLYQGDNAYSYVFSGESGYLDHALSTSGLELQIVGANQWHINADEPRVLDFNTEYKSTGQIISFYNPDVYRTSDHDAEVIGLEFYDYSDLPGYALARHLVNGPILGTKWHAGTSAVGSGTNDGVVLTPGFNWRKGPQGGSLDVSVTGIDGYISAWLDWNQDNSFSGEEIFTDEPCTAGSTCTIQFTVHLSPDQDSYNIRVRIYDGPQNPDRAVLLPSPSPGLSPEGDGDRGEVEDYNFTITVKPILFLPLIFK